MIIPITYQFKLYHRNQNVYLDRLINIAASIWNHCIALHRRYYKMYHKTLSKYALQKHITKLKKRESYRDWNQLNSQAIQDITDRIDRAYKAFFDNLKTRRFKKKSPPHFKKQEKYKSITFKQCGYKFDGDNGIIVGKKHFKYFNSRPIEGKIKTVTIKRDGLGDFYIYVVVEKEFPDIQARTGNAVGMDFGLKCFLTFDDGTHIKSPEWFKASLSEIRAAHRKVSRCKKGSNNYKRAVQHLARVYRKIANRRRDYFFKLAKALVDKFAIICIEDLNLEAMKRIWGRKVSDLSYCEFVNILQYMALKSGTKIIKIDRWAPSSKACHKCGWINKQLTLKDRTWTCVCGALLDRDINAAINIKKLGLATLH